MKNLNFNKSIIAIVLSVLLQAQEITAQTQIESISEYNSVFWEISGNNLKKNSYLFGTIHLIPEKEYKFDDIVWDKFNLCKTLVLEINIDLAFKQQFKLAKKMIFPDGKNLKDFVTTDQYSAIQDHLLDSLKLGKSTLRKVKMLKPIFSTAIILNDLIEDPLTIETELNEIAKKRKMRLTGLETLEFQIGLFDSISIEKQVEMLFVSLIQSNPIEEYNKILAAYKQQDLKKIFELSKKDKDFKLFEEGFLIKRNNKWINKIRKLINEDCSFIAVGAAHLYGEDGLVALLRKEGYTVKAIK